MQSVRIYEIPACKMISSGIGMFGEEKFNLFDWLLSPFMFGSNFKFNSPDWFIAQLFIVEVINVLIRITQSECNIHKYFLYYDIMYAVPLQIGKKYFLRMVL